MNPLHFFSSGTKEKEWVEIDNFPFKTKIYKQKGAMKIEKSDFELLKRGNYLNSTENQKIPPEKENLILNQLPTEILLMICEYLSPGAFTNLGLTCIDFQNIFNDQQTWRKIAKSYQIFFIFDHFKLKFNFDESKYEILGFQTSLINEIDDIQIQNQSLDFPNLSQIHFQKLNQEREKRLKKYFNNNKIDDSTMKNENSNERKPVVNSTEEERIKYIELLENPKEEMIEKARKIQHLLLKEQIKIQNEIKYGPRREKFADIEIKSDGFSVFFMFLVLIGFSIYLVLITLKIEKKMNTKLTYLSLSVVIPLFGFFILFFIFVILSIWAKEFKSMFERKDRIFLFLLFLTFFLTMVEFLLIGLRVDNFIKCSWIIIFIPFLFLFISLIFSILFLIKSTEERLKDWKIMLSFCFLCIIFLIFLGLRIDGTIKWNYGIVFLPIYVYVFFYFFYFCFCFQFISLENTTQRFSFMVLVIVILLPFLVLITLYLENIIYHIYYPLIPIYIFSLLFSFSFCVAILLLFCCPNFGDQMFLNVN
ncbi:dactylin [Anaeramoeba ignava]|uniref:Dactylin n=1 Tax=Anaeramoeba ignava TaxID=1746090 RepID=A0A9Q0R871_ANAIG|nr:dactylin [Anaeramoeba ignava]